MFTDGFDDISTYGKDEQLSIGEQFKKWFEYQYENNINQETKVFPDKFGCYKIFVFDMYGQYLCYSMPKIMRAFFEHEGFEVSKFNDVNYSFAPRGFVSLQKEVYIKCLNILFNAYKQGNNYAKQLLTNIIKYYWKDDYKILKKYSELSFKDIMYNGSWEKWDNEEAIMAYLAINLTFAEILDIKISDDTAIFYERLNFWADHLLEKMKKNVESTEDKPEVISKVEELLKQKNEEYPCPSSWTNLTGRGYRHMRLANKVLNNAFKYNGFGTEFSWASITNFGEEIPPYQCMEITLNLLLNENIDKEYSFEDIQSLSALTYVALSFSETVRETLHMLDSLFNSTSNDYSLHISNFDNYDINPNVIPKEVNLDNVNIDIKIENTDPKSASLEEDERQELLNEIEKLRIENHKKDEKLFYVQALYRDKNRAEKKYNEIAEKYGTEHDELVHIKDYLYGLSESDIAPVSVDIKELKTNLKERKIIIIGGHENWRQKLKGEFPNWEFITPKAADSIDESIVLRCDYVYFYTDCLAHCTFYKFIDLIRRNHVKYSYLNSTNIDNNIRQIYKDLNSD